jgi:hypothetical protein
MASVVAGRDELVVDAFGLDGAFESNQGFVVVSEGVV